MCAAREPYSEKLSERTLCAILKRQSGSMKQSMSGDIGLCSVISLFISYTAKLCR